MTSARLVRDPAPSAQPAGGDRLRMVDPSTELLITIPHIDSDLIPYLKHVFAASLGPDLSIRDYDRMLGQQLVIEHLEALRKRQEEE